MSYFTTAASIWSFRRELQLVCLSFLLVALAPILAVFMLSNSGIDIVSDRLATVDTQTQAIEIHDPTTGEVVSEIHPVVAWPVSGVYTAEFGDITPYQLFHSGIDIAGPKGTPVHPFMEGTVVYAGEIWWGFGKHVILDHGNHITSVYAHLDKIFVVKGHTVTINQVLGNRGSTGWSTGPHLHFQINVYGLPVDPRTFMGSLTNGQPIQEAPHDH